ncbi:MAG: hypothetical protein KJ650_01365, partial [Firmicutes bacterium]|nr:hypothetical protein [Bacillota bacterium]MBV1727143.1 hypothetical protein [Desulforudis sp.]
CDSALKPRDFYRELLYQFGIRPQYLRSEAKTGEIGAGKSAAIRTLRESHVVQPGYAFPERS